MVDACKSLPRSQGQDAGEGKENEEKEKKTDTARRKEKAKWETRKKSVNRAAAKFAQEAFSVYWHPPAGSCKRPSAVKN